MLKKLYSSAMTNVDFPSVSMFKPNSAKSKYLEIGVKDLVQVEVPKGSKEEPSFHLPRINCLWKRGTSNGLTFMVVLHPALKQGGTYIIEGEEGKDILGEMAGFSFSAKALSQLGWVCRIYELSTTLPAL